MQSITLYQAANEVAEAFDQMDPETGELGEGYADARELVERKGVATIAYIGQRDAEIEMVDGVIKQLQDKRKTMAARNERLRGYVLDCMRVAGITEIGAGALKAKRYPERDESVDIFELDLLPAQYLVQPPAPPARPDKTAIKTAIKTGVDVPGARIVAKDRLSIK